LIAHATSLPIALGGVAGLLALVAIAAGRVLRRSEPEARA
jgi:MYXO-CTERM domain-containing protein